MRRVLPVVAAACGGAMDGGRSGSGATALWCSQNVRSLNAESASVDTARLASYAACCAQLVPPASVGRSTLVL